MLSPCIEGGVRYIFRYEVTCVEESSSACLDICDRERGAYATPHYFQCIFVVSLGFALSEAGICYAVENIGYFVSFDNESRSVYICKFHSVALVAECAYAFVLSVGDFL